MNRALILGCSHAVGSEMFSHLEETRYHSYPALIAKKLNFIVDNRAIAGGSNDAMFRIYEEEHAKLDSTDIVIACWTGFNRTEIYNADNNQWIGLAPGKEDITSTDYQDYQQQWLLYNSDYYAGRLNKIKNILALNSLTKQRDIQVVNIDSFFPVDEFDWGDSVVWSTNIDFWTWANDNGFPRTELGHFFEPAHEKFSEFVVNLLKSEVDKV